MRQNDLSLPKDSNEIIFELIFLRERQYNQHNTLCVFVSPSNKASLFVIFTGRNKSEPTNPAETVQTVVCPSTVPLRLTIRCKHPSPFTQKCTFWNRSLRTVLSVHLFGMRPSSNDGILPCPSKPNTSQFRGTALNTLGVKMPLTIFSGLLKLFDRANILNLKLC